ncbi:hypothetical protein GQ600_6321 [Phytophthora cactorum]|nr:hypothetical protein GQ600_6321 [Phytophthora cactorum]
MRRYQQNPTHHGQTTQLNDTAEQEFSKLEQLLIQTADEVSSCLKALKSNLSEYDKRHGLLFLNTSMSFMRSGIRAAKDIAAELKHVAHQIDKSEGPSESEITAARSKIHRVSDAMLNLRKTARAYDRKNHLESLSELKAEEGRSNQDYHKSESEGSWFSEESSGFSALKHQVSVAEEALSPSFVDHVMNTMASMSNSLKGEKISSRKAEKRKA